MKLALHRFIKLGVLLACCTLLFLLASLKTNVRNFLGSCEWSVAVVVSILSFATISVQFASLMCYLDNLLHLQGAFSLRGIFPDVRDNVQLIQGLFSDSLPPFIQHHYKNRDHHDITYLHIDCDLYHGEHYWVWLPTWCLTVISYPFMGHKMAL